MCLDMFWSAHPRGARNSNHCHVSFPWPKQPDDRHRSLTLTRQCRHYCIDDCLRFLCFMASFMVTSPQMSGGAIEMPWCHGCGYKRRYCQWYANLSWLVNFYSVRQCRIRSHQKSPIVWPPPLLFLPPPCLAHFAFQLSFYFSVRWFSICLRPSRSLSSQGSTLSALSLLVKLLRVLKRCHRFE